MICDQKYYANFNVKYILREYSSPLRPVYYEIEVLKLIIGKEQAGEHCVMKTNYPNKCILYAALFLAYLGFEAP